MYISKKQWNKVLVFGATLVLGGSSWAQEAVQPSTPILPTVPSQQMTANDPAQTTSVASPSRDPAVPVQSPLGPLQERGRSLNTNNTFSQSISENGNTISRDHTVINPQGQMTQSWQRSSTEDGYQFQRQQIWTAPDGTITKQHEMTFSGTDPYNYQRQKTITLPGGRTVTMEQTRTWDGTTGTMERTFSGPNGQTQSFQRSWTPEGAVSPPQETQTTPAPTTAQIKPAVTVPPNLTTTPSSSPSEKSGGNKLNPFNSSTGNDSKTAVAGRRSGFTVGTRNHGNLTGRHYGGANQQPSEAELPRQTAARSNAAQKAHGNSGSRGSGNH